MVVKGKSSHRKKPIQKKRGTEPSSTKRGLPQSDKKVVRHSKLAGKNRGETIKTGEKESNEAENKKKTIRGTKSGATWNTVLG